MHKFKYKGNNKELIEQSKILIIEDNRSQRLMLRQTFKDYGFKCIFEAENGQEGWEKTLEIDPDLVLLDINMPVMDGFAYCNKARGHIDYKNISIIVQTGLTDLKDKAKIFEVGATDYITKPLDPYEVAARSFIHLERLLYLKDLEEFSTRIKNELIAVKELVNATLPCKRNIIELQKAYNIDLAAEFKSSQEMEGDFWGFYQLNKTQIAVYCIDMSGHGIDSGLNALRTHSIMHANPEKLSQPGDFLTWLNKKLIGLFPLGQFATMFYGIIDTNKNTLSYSTAASTSPIIFCHNDFSLRYLSGKGFPLGIDKNSNFKTNCIPFKAGETLILYSDAIIEANDKKGKMFGEDRFSKLINISAKKGQFSSQKFLDDLLNRFYKECGNKLDDDLTINIYHRL